MDPIRSGRFGVVHGQVTTRRVFVGAATGGKQIRAGLAAGWRVGDKTGSGTRGEDNDVAVAWPPGRAPLVIAVYTVPSPAASAAPNEPCRVKSTCTLTSDTSVVVVAAPFESHNGTYCHSTRMRSLNLRRRKVAFVDTQRMHSA